MRISRSSRIWGAPAFDVAVVIRRRSSRQRPADDGLALRFRSRQRARSGVLDGPRRARRLELQYGSLRLEIARMAEGFCGTGGAVVAAPAAPIDRLEIVPVSTHAAGRELQRDRSRISMRRSSSVQRRQRSADGLRDDAAWELRTQPIAREPDRERLRSQYGAGRAIASWCSWSRRRRASLRSWAARVQRTSCSIRYPRLVHPGRQHAASAAR